MATKKSASKNSKTTGNETIAEKPKKEFDFEGSEPLAEKMMDEETMEESGGEEDFEGDTPDLDDEELNPFDDKWEQ